MSPTWLMEEGARVLTVWLAQGVWQASLVALVAALALWLLRGRSARLRYAVGCLALAALVLAPVGSLLLSAPEAVREEAASRAVEVAPSGLEGARTEAPPVGARVFVPQAAASGDVLGPWPRVLGGLWLLGACVGLARLLVGGWRTSRRLVRPATPVSSALSQTVSRVSERLGLRRAVRTLESPLAPSPLVVGVVRPVLVLPQGVGERLSSAQLESVLAHELAHVRRHDTAVNLLQCLVETLFFFHPAARWLSAQVRLEREHCCDDVAVGFCGSVRLYSGALLGLEELRQSGPALVLGAGSHPLAARVRRLLGRTPVEAPRGRRWARRVGSALGVLAVSFAAWAWEAPASPPRDGKGLLAAGMCSRPVYPKDFTAIATHVNGDRTLRHRLFVSRCGRIRLEDATGASVYTLLFDVGTGESAMLNAREHTYETHWGDKEPGLPLHLPGGCSSRGPGCERQAEEAVAGRRAQRWHRVHSAHDTVTRWMDLELGYPIREESELFGTLTLSDIRLVEHGAALFTLPSDYRAEPAP
ncbi:M56 family metallopeptidase [Myxococcus fulvus]|uniref:M56 family metallopeptidase n=1 Tax=Myxococcus fulvus TaxID=33 RepID=UPI0020BE20F2|nr:M56 family metallopeptidase [Myxococcus fulvus]MCK8500044.1 M56 family metallopeptidase [Myxococcus fulvus]